MIEADQQYGLLASRSELVAPEAPSRPATELTVARTIVGEAETRVSALFLGPRSTKRVDGWVSGRGVVLQGHDPDDNEQVATSVHRGGAALVAWAQLLRMPAIDVSAVGPETLQLPSSFETVDSFVRWATEEGAPRGEALLLAIRDADGDTHYLARVSSGGGAWAAGRDNEPLQVRSGSWAAMLTELLVAVSSLSSNATAG
jgi:hypothetical protein